MNLIFCLYDRIHLNKNLLFQQNDNQTGGKSQIIDNIGNMQQKEKQETGYDGT